MASVPADLAPRVASALVLAALAFGAAYVGGHLFTLFWLIASVAVLWEWNRMVGLGAERAAFIAGAAGLAAAAGFSIMSIPEFGLVAVGAAALVCVAFTRGRISPLWSGGGVVYAGALITAACLLRGSVTDGFRAILWLFAVVWVTDVMAYVFGRAIGGPKLWPSVSPKKTWAGFLGGVSCGALAGLSVMPVASTWPVVLVLGVLTAMVSQGGDLFESSLKRRFGVKDSSQLIPGHGGVMDRLDGFIAATVFAALVGTLHLGPASAAYGLFRW